jgi:hypothetical protein
MHTHALQFLHATMQEFMRSIKPSRGSRAAAALLPARGAARRQDTFAAVSCATLSPS